MGIPARYGGWETLAEYLIKFLNKDFAFYIFCSSSIYKTNKKDIMYDAKRIFLPLKANGIQSVPYDIFSLILSCIFADVILVLGISGCIFLPVIKLFTSKQIVVAIDGLEWNRNKWSIIAKIFLKFSELMAVKFSTNIVSDNPEIMKYIKRKYHKYSHLIEYGSDHAQRLPITQRELKSLGIKKSEYALSLSRIEPENNCHIILEAFKNNSDKYLVYIGNWDNSKYGQTLKERYKHCENISIIDAIYDISLLNKIRSNAILYVHGHSCGGTNPALIESMYLGLPIIAFDVIFNRATTGNSALFFSNKDQLAYNVNLLNEKLHLKSQIGRKLKQIAEEKYLWSIIASKYKMLFNSYRSN